LGTFSITGFIREQPGLDLSPIGPCSAKNWGPSHTFFDINVQKHTVNSASQLHAVLLLLLCLRYGFLNLKALYNFASVLTRTQLMLRWPTRRPSKLIEWWLGSDFAIWRTEPSKARDCRAASSKL